MSYILEALRRAERERHLGQAPTVQTLTHTSAPQDRVPWWRTSRLALAAIVLLLVATAFLLWRKPIVDTPAAVPVAEPAEPAPAPVTAVTKEPTPAPAAVAPEVTVATPPPSVPATHTTPPATGQPLQAAIEAAEAAEVIADDEDLSSLDDLATPFAAEATTDTATTEVTPRHPAPMPTPAPVPASAPPATSPATQPETEPPLLRDMPSSYRARFPSVRMDVHVYNDDPSRRWIMVDGRRYGEGDTLASGPRIMAIRAEGVIFDHAGQRVMLPLTR